MLMATGLRRHYVSDVETVRAVDGVDLSVEAGEFVWIRGASGSGKTTLLTLLAGLDAPDAGEIVIDGVRLGGLGEAGRARLRLTTVGVVFQEHLLVEEFTAVENVALPLEVLGTRPAVAAGPAAAQLVRVGLGGLEARYPRQLSGGQRQRVGIARALVGDRRVLLADEPTGALDSVNSRELFELLRTLCDGGVLAVVCSHDPLCGHYADTVYDMTDGVLSTATADVTAGR